jgi:hypothetical protein
MKAFLVGALLALALAVGSSWVLEGYLGRTAAQAFSAPSARVVEPVHSGELNELPDRPRQ